MQYALFYIDFFVNNIQKNHHLTALNGDFIIVCVTFFIMPFIGLSPFLLNIRNKHREEISVSMPFIGLSPFLLGIEIIEVEEEFGVNALYRAFSISTCRKVGKRTATGVCQCPLSGFLHFYQKRKLNN